MSAPPPEPPFPSAISGWTQRLAGQLQPRPFLVFGLVAVVAVLVTDAFDHVPGAGLGILLLLALVPALSRRRWWAWLPFVALLFAGAHGRRLAQTYEHPLRHHLLSLSAGGEPVQARGRLYPWTEGAELDDASAIGHLMEVRLEGRVHAEPVRVRVVLPESFRLKSAGVYEIRGWISLPEPPMNPGQLDPVSYSLRNGWVAWLRAESLRLVAEDKWAPSFHLLYWAEASRRWITAALSRGIDDRPEDKAVLLAMALGASEAAGEDIEESFRDSGTLHIFAVSGLHVVMLAGVLSLSLRWLGLGRSRTVWLIIVIVFAYAYITGWRPSAARAAFMIAMVLAAVRWNRRADVHSSLGVAALVLLLWDSNQLFMPGFQLSFLVLWAIALLAPPLLGKARPWTELDQFLPPVLASGRQLWGCHARRWSAGLVCTSLAAWIGSMPLTLGHFHVVTPVGLLANLLLVPVSGISIGVSCASLVAAACGLGSAQRLLNRTNAWLARVMVVSAGWFASLPGANMAFDMRWGLSPPMEMQVFHLGSGGSSAHLRVQDRHWLLDTGNARSWRRVLGPFLRYQGINHIEGVVLTHRDAAHAGAASKSLRTGVERVITSVHEPWSRDPGLTLFDELARATHDQGVLWHRYKAGEEFAPGPGAAVQVLYPGPRDQHDVGDNRCLVLMLHLGTTRVLWLSDAGFITEKHLLEREHDLRCDVLVHGCHATDPGGLTELLLAAQPRLVISESDSIFAVKKTPARIHDYCQLHGIPHWRLETTGCITLGIGPEGTRVSAHHSGESLLLPAQIR